MMVRESTDVSTKTMKKGSLFRVYSSALLLFYGSSLWAGNVDLAVNKDGLVSIRAQEATVEEVMSSLGNRLNIKVSFPTPVTERVNVNFQELKLENAIKQVTSSYILVTGKNSPSDDIKEIIVMPEGEASSYLPQEVDTPAVQRQADEAAGVYDGEGVDEDDDDASKQRLKERIQQIREQRALSSDEAPGISPPKPPEFNRQ